MKFTLYYRGPLKSNGTAAEKHAIRKVFHKQLNVLWTQEPLLSNEDELLQSGSITGGIGIIKTVNNKLYVPLVNSRIQSIASIKINLLRPEAPGNIVTQGGDIDNRLKTLFDALKIPDAGSLHPTTIFEPDEDPFHCVLEDDNLITNVSVKTDRLLLPDASTNEVVLIIKVTTYFTRVVLGTLGLLS